MRKSLTAVVAILLLAGLAVPAGAQSRGGPVDDEKRLQRLEEQIVDLSAQIGTIESMSRGGGGPAAGGAGAGFSGDDGSRVSQMEGQVRSLSQQLDTISRRLERLEARFGMSTPSPGDNRVGDAGGRQGGRWAQQSDQGTGFSVGGLDEQPDRRSLGDTQNDASRQRETAPPPVEQRADTRSSWTTDSTPLASSPPVSASRGAASEPGGAPVRMAALSSPQAQTLFDQGYSSMMQRNYRAASESFEQFVQRYPSDPLAGSAQFWLGEAAFTSGEYRKAADMFLKSATNYPQGEKAAESMLKLGISLKRLGENDAACSSFSELSKRYPNSAQIIQRAETEKRRSNC